MSHQAIAVQAEKQGALAMGKAWLREQSVRKSARVRRLIRKRIAN
ncbi:hypothetical protein GCM10007207_03160 [Asaia siamensis]|uniref:Uncharacterized protein n=1 Tax=Asaia siamensis TaxID=110479 RepID=A0ABQ1L9A0_9PROT|nr:hypothetical protein AA0323_2313 [Asaia siamensis NRIC 0323]GGC21299.1 hypothetical protein GCM10007207_03160 [Asaia siamensis]